MENRPPKQMTVTMQREDVARNLADIVNTMEAVRVESLRNFRASDDVKLEYLRMTSEAASCMQDIINENGVADYVERIKGFIDDELLLYFDPLQKPFWDEVEPGFSKALSDLSAVVLRDDFVSEGHVHHVFQGLKYLITPTEKQDEVYSSIQPFNNLLSEELISKPEVARYVMKNLFLDFVEQSPEGYGMALLGTRLDTPEFVERLGQIGALFVDVPYAAFAQMRRSFPGTTTVGDGQDKKARILFTPPQNGSARNMFDFFSEYAAKDLGEAEECMTGSVKNIYGFGKAFLEAMQKDMGISENLQKPRNLKRVNGSSRITKDGDVYVVSNVVLYGLDEAPHTEYSEIRLDASPVSEGGNVASKNQGDWLSHYSGTDKMMLNLPLMYAILEAAYDNKDEDAAKELLESLKSDFDPNYLVMSTRFNYDQNKVWHNVTTPEQIELDVHIPGYQGYVQDIISSGDWANPLRSMFMTRDLEKIPKVLEQYENRRGYIWTPSDSRNIERVAFVGFDGGSFRGGGGNFLFNRGRSRGVGAGGAVRARQ